MKPKNFPARKLARQLKAQGIDLNSEKAKALLAEARGVRTKKRRTKK
jgi:hypothetical protein